MYRYLKKQVGRLAGIGTQSTDTEKDKLHKRFLVYMALMMSGGGLLWAAICGYHGLRLPAAIPLAYVALTVANLRYFSLSKRFEAVRFIQLSISLVLPFVFQWSLGGFVRSGSVMLWAMTAILGALTFQEVRITLHWFLAYVVLTVLSGFLGDDLAGSATQASSAVVSTLFVINIIGVSLIVFGLMIYFVRRNELAYEELELKNTALIDSQAQLVQAEKMASIGALTAGIAHEMNTPIGVINSNTDVSGRCIATIVKALKNSTSIDELENNSQFQQALKLLQSNNEFTLGSSARITKLVNSLKNFARLDEATLQKANLHEGIDSALDLISHDLRGRIEIVKEYGTIPRIICHAGELNQVFMTLLTNAVGAIEGPGTITIRSFTSGDNVHVQVEDTGVGIAPERMQRIFDPALNKKGSRVKADLGLFTSYGIVEKHKGEIKIESELGRGTCVTIILPTTL
ncbi:MAG: ATP-binding protein [Candidatus Krumholzibacteria bacterium]